jgi:hypothetical protein
VLRTLTQRLGLTAECLTVFPQLGAHHAHFFKGLQQETGHLGKGSIPCAAEPGIHRCEVEMGALLVDSQEPGVEVVSSQGRGGAIGTWGHRKLLCTYEE